MAYSDNLMTMIEQPWTFRTSTPTFADYSWSSSVYSDVIFTKEPTGTISGSPQSDNVSLPPMPRTGSESEGHVSKQQKGNSRVTKKRKSRALKRQTTTFIAADPANFREMVQQVTGVRFGGLGAAAADLAPPPPPSFDWSGYLLGARQPMRQVAGSSGVDFDSLRSFPTLESSKVQF